ncbi:MAG: hypothetical protein IK137_00290 [Bacilli bacterium]|nr:hypothetical protein [Bacilli bacterium]
MKKNSSKSINFLLVVFQFLLTIACIVLVILYFAGNKGLLDILEIVLGVDLVVTGLGNYMVHRNIKYLLIYLVVGCGILIAVILKMVGVI